MDKVLHHDRDDPEVRSITGTMQTKRYKHTDKTLNEMSKYNFYWFKFNLLLIRLRNLSILTRGCGPSMCHLNLVVIN